MAPTILCLASYFKGGAFLEECKRLGYHHSDHVAGSGTRGRGRWGHRRFFVMPFANLFKQPDITAVSFLAQSQDRPHHRPRRF